MTFQFSFKIKIGETMIKRCNPITRYEELRLDLEKSKEILQKY